MDYGFFSGLCGGRDIFGFCGGCSVVYFGILDGFCGGCVVENGF